MEREGERRSRAHRGWKVIRLVSTTACKQQNTRLYCYHTSSFEGSKFTFSVNTMYRECQNGSVYSTSIDLLFVRVMPRQQRSSWHAARDFAYQALLPLFSVKHWKAGNGTGDEAIIDIQFWAKWDLYSGSIDLCMASLLASKILFLLTTVSSSSTSSKDVKQRWATFTKLQV